MKSLGRLTLVAALVVAAGCSHDEKKDAGTPAKTTAPAPAPSPASAAPAQAPPAHPAEPGAAAPPANLAPRVGDWEVLASQSSPEVHEVRVTKVGDMTKPAVTYEVTVLGITATPERTNIAFDLHEDQALPELLTLRRGTVKSNEITSKVAHEAGGRSFECTRHVIQDTPEGGSAERTIEVWFSSDVPDPHVVSFHVNEPGKPVIDFSVVGFGHGEETTWGLAADEVARTWRASYEGIPEKDWQWVRPGVCATPNNVKAHGGMNDLGVEWDCPRCNKHVSGLRWAICTRCARDLGVCVVCLKRIPQEKK